MPIRIQLCPYKISSGMLHLSYTVDTVSLSTAHTQSPSFLYLPVPCSDADCIKYFTRVLEPMVTPTFPSG